jgi:hypothetical protein
MRKTQFIAKGMKLERFKFYREALSACGPE